MGLDNRDYARGEVRREFVFGDPVYPATQTILVLTIGVWLLQIFFSRNFDYWLRLYPISPGAPFRIWQVVTYGFLHSTTDILHIVCNMIGLWMFGRWIEGERGTQEFTAFYITAIVCGAIGHLVATSMGPPAAAVGASGAIMAIIGWAAVRYPRHEILVMFVIPMQLRFAAILFIILDAMGAGANISHGAHLGGIAFGLGYAWFGWRLTGWASRPGDWLSRSVRSARRRLRGGPPLKVYAPSEPAPPEPSPDELQARVDTILAKVSVEGEANLTDEERAILVAAADVYKRRRRPAP